MDGEEIYLCAKCARDVIPPKPVLVKDDEGIVSVPGANMVRAMLSAETAVADSWMKKYGIVHIVRSDFEGYYQVTFIDGRTRYIHDRGREPHVEPPKPRTAHK